MSDGDLIPLNAESREERAYHAYQMRLAGYDWNAIAKKMDFKSASYVQNEVNLLIKKAMNEAAEDRRSEIVGLELDRLDALQNAVWGVALTGDIKAIEASLKIMAHRARLLQLGQDNASATSTIIVAGDRYVDTLKEIAQ